MNTKHKYQNVEDLAADLSFIRWVKDENTSPHGEWYEMLVEQGSTDWIPEARGLVKAIGFAEHSVDKTRIDQLWKQIDQATDTSTNAKVRRLPYRPLSIAAAIAFLLAASFWWTFSSSATIVETSMAQTSQLVLPDGSEVTLNAQSKIEYDAKSWNTQRIVELRGEAFFNVEKGERFTVRTNTGTVEVLGTSFNVFDRDGSFVVACHTGKVRVTRGKDAVILTPGERSIWNGSNLSEQPFQVDPSKTWMNGYFLFSDARLSSVINEIERQFDVKISVSGIDLDRRYTGFFIKKNLSEALQAVCWPLRLNFDIQGNKVTISQGQE